MGSPYVCLFVLLGFLVVICACSICKAFELNKMEICIIMWNKKTWIGLDTWFNVHIQSKLL